MDFSALYGYQRETQQCIAERGGYWGGIGSRPSLPSDMPEVCAYHFLHLSSEVGELIDSDQRWKTHHSAGFDQQQKVEELADVFIEAFNIAIFSGISASDLYEAIGRKMRKVRGRVING